MKMNDVVEEVERKRNMISMKYYDTTNTNTNTVLSSLLLNININLLPFNNNKNKKKKLLLRRLPHVFNTVLQLPLRSDADVSIEETPECFRFVAETNEALGDVEAHTLRIHPGVTRIVVRATALLHYSLDDLQLDIWRFRLPESIRADLATADFVHGVLLVTVPKVADHHTAIGSAATAT